MVVVEEAVDVLKVVHSPPELGSVTFVADCDITVDVFDVVASVDVVVVTVSFVDVGIM